VKALEGHASGGSVASVDALLDRCGMRALMEARLTRRIGRSDNREVWR
jgi:hypothetical protein